MEIYISFLGLAISLVTVGFLYRQIRDSARATKTQLAVGLIDQLHSNNLVQEVLELILADNVEFKTENGMALITSNQNSAKRNIYLELNILLNRFQVLAHSYHLRVLDETDLRGIRYEIIEIGRNKAVREYLKFLNSEYQKSSEVIHDHFASLKELYLAFEYDPSHQEQFKTIPIISF